jgi:hypothetical protein
MPLRTQNPVIRNWQTLNRKLPDMAEEEVTALLNEELNTDGPREYICLRLHSRINYLRREREREAITRACTLGE